MEEVDERPQQVGEVIVLEAVCRSAWRSTCFNGIVELGLHGVGFGQWPRIRVRPGRGDVAVGERASSSRCAGRRGSGKFGIGIAVGEGEGGCRCVTWRGAFLPEDQPRRSRPSTAIPWPAAQPATSKLHATRGVALLWAGAELEDGARSS